MAHADGQVPPLGETPRQLAERGDGLRLLFGQTVAAHAGRRRGDRERCRTLRVQVKVPVEVLVRYVEVEETHDVSDARARLRGEAQLLRVLPVALAEVRDVALGAAGGGAREVVAVELGVAGHRREGAEGRLPIDRHAAEVRGGVAGPGQFLGAADDLAGGPVVELAVLVELRVERQQRLRTVRHLISPAEPLLIAVLVDG